MNLVLFEAPEIGLPLPRTDPRAEHLLAVLRRVPGDTFDAGVVNGPRGKGTIVAVKDRVLELSFVWGEPPPPAAPLTLLIGLPRPQTARKILQAATALGVSRMEFFTSEKGEGGYALSTLWTTGEWHRHVVVGAAQAFDTHIPEVTAGAPLAVALSGLPQAAQRLALDNYEAGLALGGAVLPAGGAVVLAVGSERGWSAAERDLLRSSGFGLVHLGPRVLRVETAVVAALALVRSKMGWLG